MIAELNGKISSRGTNLKETLEDNLTGNVFGSLRYIPFSKGMKNILLQAIEPSNFNDYESEEWAEKIEFWPYHKDGELDVIIDLNLAIIGIEVKYNSGLSSDDEISNDDINKEISLNQLSRESRIIEEMARLSSKKPILLFIARENEGKEIVSNVMDRGIIEEGVELKFISWEVICSVLEKLYKSPDFEYYEKVVLGDIYKLLVRKGFESFRDFNNITKSVVDKDKYYTFYVNEEHNSILYDDEEVNFITNIKVMEGDYYEFL